MEMSGQVQASFIFSWEKQPTLIPTVWVSKVLFCGGKSDQRVKPTTVFIQYRGSFFSAPLYTIHGMTLWDRELLLISLIKK
jgi:hypothetical protein